MIADTAIQVLAALGFLQDNIVFDGKVQKLSNLEYEYPEILEKSANEIIIYASPMVDGLLYPEEDFIPYTLTTFTISAVEYMALFEEIDEEYAEEAEKEDHLVHQAKGTE